MSGDLKYRARFTTSIDKGIYIALYNYSIDSKIPMSRLADEAFADFLNKYGIEFSNETPYKKTKMSAL